MIDKWIVLTFLLCVIPYSYAMGACRWYQIGKKDGYLEREAK